MRLFAAAIGAAPDFYEACYHQGVAEAQLNRDEEALRSFQTAIDLSDGHYPRAEFGYRAGNARDAERVVRHGLQTDANIADGHVVLSLVRLKLNRLKEAEKSAQEALRFDEPSSAKAHLILADIRGESGDLGGQARELDAYLQRYPNDRSYKMLDALRDIAKRLASKNAQPRGERGEQSFR